MNRFKLALLLSITPMLLAWKPFSDPAEQCLDSFKDKLISPTSAKVYKFDGQLLSYLYKNSYGVEVQAKALCKEWNGKWQREPILELIAVMELGNERMRKQIACMEENKKNCLVIHPTISNEEAKRKLGFELLE